MKRNEFIKTACIACSGGFFLNFLQSCSAVHFVNLGIENNKISLNKAEFIFLKKDKEIIRQWVLVKNEKLPFPIGIFRKNDSEFSAVYLKCSHQGCEVEPQGDALECPCHGSEYTNAGKVTKGPAEEDLKTFKVTSNQSQIFIEI